MTKTITLSADETLITRARERAAREKTSLDQAIRDWLERYARREGTAETYSALMDRLSYAEAGRAFMREELNER